MIEVTKSILKSIYKPRPQDAKKYDFGLLLVIGGSEFYSGSPALASLAAFKAGCDMVRIIAPKRAADIIASFSPILAAYPLAGDWLEKKHVTTLLAMAESAKSVSHGKTALVIGGGMGRSRETQEAILEFLSTNTLPAVIDADAIHALVKDPSVVKGENSIITPNTFEFYILTGKEVYKLPDEEKIKIVQEQAERFKTTILLKGRTDIISDGKEIAVNKTGGPYLAKGGTGDSLSGLAGAFLARGIDAFTAAQAAAYVNGLSGELAAKKFGESLVATDLIESIYEVIR
ncbi:MAG: NAD(P)H-hydrate dehydratase [Candidatus Wildermuthbacteria bacterium GWA2_46_15]|uniref:ADP-dependent (S)-NAD(P)H-hydrate dehydratase n=1 Tax=Candidatus Wildermuthbacteria bacterium GWA2_46_15 TaxID=1802443 RepID=A0A1G2QPH4_9BACT|nr:MAG: NAD(P)H-hydrate dehydratase [Candidatus Wildermuthbacteria bacterium GWA2_46_15]